MIRYIKLYLYFLRFSFSKAMEFRIDFFFRIFMDIMYYILNIAFYKIIFIHTNTLGGWNMQQMMIFISSFLVIDAISMTVFANNLWMLSEYINKGDMDYYLVRPVSSLFFLSLRDFAADSFVNLILAFSLMSYSLIQYIKHISIFKILLFLTLIILGAILRYFVRMIFLIPAFWTHSSRGLEMVFFNLNRFIERPDRIFTGFVRIILTSILPFCIMASFPARILIDPINIKLLFHFFIVFIIFGFIVKFLWNKGLKAYSSASS